MSRSMAWYVRRLRVMSPAEVLSRAGDRGRQVRWARRRVAPGAAVGPVPGLRAARAFVTTLPTDAAAAVPTPAHDAVIAAADRLLRGEWELLGFPRPDIADPDWFLDVVTGRRAPQDQLAFRVDQRDEAVTGNIKAVWELSRHHHLTVLAAAWWLTHDDRYALAVDRQLRSWWAANPFLSGVHWTSGIELGVRLTSWVWVRRLLDAWTGAPALFEENPDALLQLRWHQEFLAAFRSRGSSANNHVIAEAVGRLAAACAFPWFRESDQWRTDSAAELEAMLAANTFASGLNREQASDYHRFVTELGLIALVEADSAGHPLGEPTRRLLTSSLDAAAALLDVRGRPPRQGDGDEGRGLVLDDPDADPWVQLLAIGAATVGGVDWWPDTTAGVASTAMGALAPRLAAPLGSGRRHERGEVASTARPVTPPRAFPDAGLYVLRTPEGHEPQIWCRCDGGPQGFLSIAAHGHADALSVEVRVGGVDVLADPGTYCYHGEPQWRSYFRSTRAHNTVELDGVSQSVEGGPFLWTTRTDATVDSADLDGAVQTWAAHHVGYRRRDPAARHDRSVALDSAAGTLAIDDTIVVSTRHTVRLAWHLGPDVTAEVSNGVAHLTWPTTSGVGSADLRLPPQLDWSAHRGEESPVLGWYSPRFGARVPATTLVGQGAVAGALRLTTVLAVPALALSDGHPAGRILEVSRQGMGEDA